MQAARAGALGGATNEAGATHRAGIAALLVTYGLLGEGVPWLKSSAPVVTLRLEADRHVDDVVVDLADDTCAYMQAKLSASPKAFQDTVDQWCRSITSGECRAGDELLLVVTRAPKNIQVLAEALTTRRAGASPTSAESRELQRLQFLAAGQGLNQQDTTLLLDAAKIQILDARDDQREEFLGVACLTAAVVPVGHGQAAFRALRAAVRHQAEQRASSQLPAWLSWLADAQLPLVADREGAAAARLQARLLAVRAYRESWAAQQDLLPLGHLGFGVESMTVDGVTGSLTADSHPPREVRDGLADAVRRQGRLMLVGRPGSGKTVASRLIAARWAATDLAPVPVWLRLRDLVPLLNATGPSRLDLADVVQAATDEQVLQEALIEYIERGEALLLLDALDEVLDRQDAVIEAVADLIGRLPAELDVVITTRHSAAPAAERLELPVYELREPTDLEATLDQLLHTVAAKFAGHEDTDVWIADRTQRIEQSQRAEPDLWRVPLLATLMVLLIAQSPAAAVPSSRAGLLSEVINSSVRRWETARPYRPVPDTDPDLTAEVLLDCFDDIAHLIAASGSASWQDTHAAVTARLQQHWGKPAGVAAAMARHVLEYWDAAAGIFITDTPNGQLTARTRLFAEIGEVRWALKDQDGIAEWMQELLADPGRHECGRLAASLSPTAAHALVTRALDDGGRLLDLVHDAVTDGAVFEPDALHACSQAQLDRLDTVPDSYPAPKEHGLLDLNRGRSPRAELAARLADDELDPEQTGQLITAAGQWGPRQQAVITALCAQRQARQRGTALTDRELDTLEAALVAAAGSDPNSLYRVLAGLDELVHAAVVHLLPQRSISADVFTDAAYKASYRTVQWLETELPRLGHHAASQALKARRRTPFNARQLAESFAAIAEPFDLFAELDTTPVTLTPDQAWHLDAAAGFIEVLGIADEAAMIPAEALQQQPELTERICRIVLDCISPSTALICAQLRSLRDERPQHPDWGLLYLPGTRTPTLTLTPSTVDTGLVIEALQGANPWLVHLAVQVAGSASSVDASLQDRLLAVLPELSAQVRLHAGTLLAHRWPDLALPQDDPAVRAGAARIRAFTLAREGRHREARGLLSDPDLLVREHAARFLRTAPAADETELKEALATPATQWTCTRCDITVQADADQCANRHPRPSPRLTP
ncbi:NACHT domain-containing protein [Streptomyces ossamyceticus]|uniref:NACHT domain-containing protein n=1 Tax=Streptomyces ossamyceticus TaxID=249581 RepID=UPI0006E3F09E|nr:NACHT domain-containing protein [Streptomyces ossamyceticus]